MAINFFKNLWPSQNILTLCNKDNYYRAIGHNEEKTERSHMGQRYHIATK